MWVESDKRANREQRKTLWCLHFFFELLSGCNLTDQSHCSFLFLHVVRSLRLRLSWLDTDTDGGGGEF